MGGGIALFGPESSLAPSASMAVVGQVLRAANVDKFLAEGDGTYEDHRLMQQAMTEFAAGGGGDFYILPPEPRGPRSYCWNGTVEIPSGVRVRGLGGQTTIKAKAGMAVPLFKFADNGDDYSLDGLVLDGNAANVSGGARLVTIGANARRVGIDVRGLNVKAGVVAIGSVRDLRIGRTHGEIDPLTMGAAGGAYLATDGAVTSGLNILDSAAGGFTQDMEGMALEVTRAGATDFTNVYRRNLVTTVQTYVSPTRVLMAANAQATVSGQRLAVYQDDTARFAEAALLSSAARSPIRLAAGDFVGSILLGSKASLKGAGMNMTTLRAPLGATAIQYLNAIGGEVADLTVEGYGPDQGGASAGVFQQGVLVQWSQQITLRNIHARYCHVGFGFTNASDSSVDIPTQFLFLDNLFASSITTSNDTAGGTGGLGFWFFNTIKHVEATNLRSSQTGKHGLYIDSGTSTGPQSATSHGLNEDFDIANVAAVSSGFPGQDGLSSPAVAVGITSGKAIRIGTVGIDAPDLNSDGLDISGDQNGEACEDCRLGIVTIERVGAQAVAIQGLRNQIDSLLIKGFNRSQSASYKRPISFGTYGSYSDAATDVPTGDTTDNKILSATVIYDGLDPAMFDFAVVFAGGLVVPDGLGPPSRTVTDAAISAGGNVLDSATANFVNAATPAGDVGRMVVVQDALGAGIYLSAKIISVNSATEALLSIDAAATVTGKTLYIGRRVAAVRRNRVVDYNFQTPLGTPIRTLHDAAMTVGDYHLDSATAVFTSADLGRMAWVQGAGPSGGYLAARIVSITSGTRVVLAARASVTVAASLLYVGTAVGGRSTSSGGATYGPTTGADANGVGPLWTAQAGGAIVAQASIAGDVNDRIQVMTDGIRMGDGVNAPAARMSLDANGHISVNGLFAAQNLPSVHSSYVANGTIDFTSSSLFASLDGTGVAGPLAMTMGAPTAGTHDGRRVEIGAKTAHAHTIVVTGGVNGGGGATDLVTLGGAIGDAIVLEAWDGVWWLVSSRNAALS